MTEQIFLIGFRATGKTTIGKLLADRLGFAFVDTDQLICRKLGRTVQEIVRNTGWDGFRRHEAEALLEVAGVGQSVVATGGGAILHKELWPKIRQQALVIWLTADNDILMQRLRGDRGSGGARPSLTGGQVDNELIEVLAKRQPLYRKFSHGVVDTGVLATVDAVESIVNVYQDNTGKEKKNDGR